eukprot:gnl/TRDRNA2_/TRDRNA2_173959_c2_seq49.p1 gnl/TRDRNA2_/TRDRNA2_173959_c2~~gnl/TRDRNA2_/TRDRNA2_173959_c2_seq49.p1  ORF type:complete len:651 (-),score=194.21 gnl/TRDRNA2_/TRDRNA2_173959_c2_seq49:57-2009(-)
MAAAATTSGIPQFASLYVGDIHSDVTEAMLYEIFNNVGPVASIRVCRDSVTRRSLGYSYVNFHSVSDAERAIDTLNYTPIKGRACRIMWSQRDPSLRKSGVGNVFVKNLDPNIDNKALYDTFSLFGNILTCKVVTDPKGKSRGYGFVHYETEEAAKQAIERVNGMQIGEQTVNVAAFVKKSGREVDKTVFTNIYIKCFPKDWDEDKIKEVFGAFGTISSSSVTSDPKGRKFAFVAYEQPEQAKAAVEAMHLKDLRSDEDKAADADKKEEEMEKDQSGHPMHLCFCGRAQSKLERQQEMREKNPKEPSSRSQPPQGVNLYIKNLDENMDDAGLRALFEPFAKDGAITSVATAKDEQGKCKGFGFVSFALPDDATKAVTEMHLKVIKGKPLYVGLAEKRAEREERLRQRYSPSASAGPGKGGMGDFGMGGKGGGFGGMQTQMYSQQPQGGGMPGMYFAGSQGMMGGGKGPGMAPGMMNPMQAAAMQGGPRPMMMGAGGARPMMGNMQMMQMMQMQQMMAAKGAAGGKGGMMGGMGGPTPGGMGMMRPPMPQQMQQGGMGMMRPPMPQQQQPPPSGGSLSAATLAAAPPGVQKQMLGEKLYPAIAKYQPALAGKITGMMLEMDTSELLTLLESEQQMKVKIDEALRVLQTMEK